jgi:uncharacterized delta-60 repeat protein
METLPDPLPRTGSRTAAAPVRAFAAIRCLSLAALALLPPGVGAQSANDGYRPDPDYTVRAMVVQPDGKLLIGGAFNICGALGCNHLARFNADGSLDANFHGGANDVVRAIALQPDRKLFIAGDFGMPRSKLARLNPDGSVDEAFGDVNPNGTIHAIAIQSDGRPIVAGEFDFIGGQSRFYLARFFPNGTIDTSFNPELPHDGNGWVSSLVLQPDGKLIIGGGFESVGGHPSRHVARLNSDGSADTTFTANGGFAVSLALQPDGKILAGSNTDVYRLNADGSLDTAFAVDVNSSFGITGLALEADGNLLLVGEFAHVNGEPRHGIARVHPDGSLDAAFAQDMTGSVYSLAVQIDGKPIIGGAFTSIDGHTVFDLARFYPDGRLDATWTLETPRAQDNIKALAVQPDGKWVVGGEFTSIGGQARNYLARVNADGSVDAAFNPDASNGVTAVVVQPDGKLLAGGYFGNIGGVPRGLLARLYADGTVDGGFIADIDTDDSDSTIVALLQQPDGKIVVAGNFYTAGGQSRPYLARLDSQGHLDAAFAPNPNDYVYALALQADGKLLVGGVFSTIGGQARNHIARLNADGSADATYDPDANGAVYALAVQPDGKVVAGGAFTAMGGLGRERVARLDIDGSVDETYDPRANNTVYTLALQTDGALLAGGWFTVIGGQARNRIARLDADGGVDASFDPDADNFVSGLGLQVDGKPVAGGGFSTIGGQLRNRIARLSTPQSVLQAIDISGSVVTWTRSGPGAELSLPPQLLVSANNDEYEAVGTMQRTAGGWRYEGFTPPQDHDVYWLRVQGQVRSGFLNGSGGLIESTRIVHVIGNDGIFANGFE